MENQVPFFDMVKKNAIVVFIFVCIVALIEQTCSKKKQVQTVESVNSELTLTTQDETAVHEAAHYIVYVAATRQAGAIPEPLSIEIKADGSGAFTSKSYCNLSTKIVTNFAGYAAVAVFYNLDPGTVFQKTKTQPDFKQAIGVIGNDEAAQYKNFLIAIEWVKTYRNSILNFAARLKNEKSIKF